MVVVISTHLNLKEMVSRSGSSPVAPVVEMLLTTTSLIVTMVTASGSALFELVSTLSITSPPILALVNSLVASSGLLLSTRLLTTRALAIARPGSCCEAIESFRCTPHPQLSIAICFSKPSKRDSPVISGTFRTIFVFAEAGLIGDRQAAVSKRTAALNGVPAYCLISMQQPLSIT